MPSMLKRSHTDVRDIDLNLLVAFEALMEARSVTRAAERLRIGQPSASHALKRLRELLDDPILVRTPTGMAPTPRALALAEPVRAILSAIEATLFSAPTFDAAQATRIFRVGATDYAQAVIAPRLFRRVQELAPGCKLLLMITNCDTVARQLERGEIDVAIGVFPDAVATPHRAVLYREDYLCVFDAAACGVRQRLSYTQWLALPHAIMSTRGDYTGTLDELLAVRGDRREVVTSTPNFLALPWLLKGRRLVCALPTRLARDCAAPIGLKTCPLPFEAPAFDISMLWHSRSSEEAGARWLREQVVAAVAGK